jgi:hypothetical protein
VFSNRHYRLHREADRSHEGSRSGEFPTSQRAFFGDRRRNRSRRFPAKLQQLETVRTDENQVLQSRVSPGVGC